MVSVATPARQIRVEANLVCFKALQTASGSSAGPPIRANVGLANVGLHDAAGVSVGMGYFEYADGVMVDFVESGGYEIKNRSRTLSSGGTVRPFDDPTSTRIPDCNRRAASQARELVKGA